MKTPVTLALIALCLTAHAQTLRFSFAKTKDDFRQLINGTHQNLITSLSRTGFTNADTIDVLFHYSMEYEVVHHNIINATKIENLYRNIVLHASLLKMILANTKLQHFRIYVEIEKERYLFTDYEDLSLNPMILRMPDREFNRYNEK